MEKTKLRIDLVQGIVEVEGNDAFVRLVYADFKDKLLSSAEIKDSGKTKPTQKKKEQQSKKISPPKKAISKKRSRGGSVALSFVKDLDLSGGETIECFKDFYEKYKPASNYERNLLFVYYLQHKMELKGITLNHIFTCYRNVGTKVPSNLRKSVSETGATKGWLETSSSEDIKTIIAGINFVEHDMKKANADE